MMTPARIRLTGKHAVGEHRYTLVDQSDYAWLSQWRWKAKPNGGGNNVYAVRNVVIDGKSVTVRMHREILGMARTDRRDVDHIDHDGLNNQRENLRPATRSENLRNAREVLLTFTCVTCARPFMRAMRASGVGKVAYCSSACRPVKVVAPKAAVFFGKCKQCNVAFTARRSRREYCTRACARRARYLRRGA